MSDDEVREELKGWKDIPIGGKILEAGNSKKYKTGDWRTFRPIHKPEICTNCMICWMLCPDSCIKVGKVDDPNKGQKGLSDKPTLGNFGGFDMNFCKGCGICAEECPFKAIEMREEKEFKD
jgi:pyruvate ferredoxin oxidoreductase delta subunit